MPGSRLSHALEAANGLDAARRHDEAARLLDAALNEAQNAPGNDRFRALVLRADLAVTLGNEGEARGILAEARQVALSKAQKEALETDLRRADDLETFLTHRGCAG